MGGHKTEHPASAGCSDAGVKVRNACFIETGVTIPTVANTNCMKDATISIGGPKSKSRVAVASIERTFSDAPNKSLLQMENGAGLSVLSILHQLSRQQSTTIIVVTHDLEIAGKTDKTFKLQDGKIVPSKTTQTPPRRS